MIKKNWKLLVITSIVIVLPILAGLIWWEQLPAQIPVHWNVKGEVDGWSNKAWAVFGLPSLLLAIQWLCVLFTNADPKRQNHSEKMQRLVFWLIPVLSLVLGAVTYLTAMGKEVSVTTVLMVFLGFMFIAIGNYLPKCKQNYTIGIKIPWTLNSEENWNRTHRVSGGIWVIGGLVVMAGGIFDVIWISIAAPAVMAIVPVIYSYLLHRKGV